MGQEASLPTDDVVDDLDEQARAPPSSTNPPAAGSGGSGSGSGSGTNGAPTGTGRSNGSHRSSKMMGAMFHRGSNNGGGGGNAAGAAASAGQHGSENYESRESARAAASGGNFYLNDGSSEEYYSANGANGQSQAQDPHQQYPQQQYPQQQRYQQQQQHQQQQHQQPPPPPPHPPPNYSEQQQQYYDANGMPQQHQQQQQQQQQPYPQDTGDQPIVSVMYEGKAPSKRGLSRAGARGAALIHSMRNMSLGGALRGSKQQQQQQQQQQHSNQQQQHSNQQQNTSAEVTDWEKQWDEDEDDSEGEEDEPKASASNQAGAAGLPLHQIRPGMDVGHSSGPQQHELEQQQEQQQHDMSLEFQQLAAPSAILPTVPLSPSKSSNNANSNSNFGSPEMLAQSQQQQHQTVDLLSDPNVTVISQDDGLEWDTGGVHGSEEAGNLKPNVQMFLPMLRVLGKGSFGKVVLVQKRVGKERGQLFAMKILRKTHLVKRRQIERTRTERKVLSVVNHPFIMKLHYAFQSHDKLYLVLDYCPGGELFFHLSRFRRFPERVARFYAAELLLAIGHLHKRGIIYRDLKPENVLLDADGHVKLGDFGLAKAGIRHPFEGAISMCGTPEYMAPEVLAQQGHGFCVDYWGLGMLVFEMMTGLPPWYTTDRAKLFRRLKSAPLEVPSYFSVQSASCVSELLDRDPRRRLGVTGIRTAMEHDFFRNISWRSLYARHVEAPIRPCEGWTPPEGAKEDLLDMGNGSSDMDASDIEKMGSHDLEAATANFDSTFTRMPIESEDQGQDAHSDEGDDELNEETFLGFTFDGKDPAATSPSRSSRQRSQIYHTGSNQSPNQNT